MTNEKGSLSINSENLFPIIKKWLYSDKDIFIRELVSNAVDAIQKRKHLISLSQAAASEDPWKVVVLLNKEAKTITISDNGIGMTADEVKKYINQIAFSGASEFAEKYKDSAEDPIIGHFGLGFYSAFMVSSLVEIDTLSVSEGAEAVHWSCDGSSSFDLSKGSRTECGTDIILHVNEEGEKYLDLYEMRTIASKYCSFMAIPVYLDTEDDRKKRQEDEKAVEPSPINEVTPLYVKAPSECTDEEYKAFYTKTFSDYKEPLFWIHLNMDYPYNLKGILYFPKLGNQFESAEGQVKLYCNQVFVADNVKEIIPEFLLLLKGVIDCPDIPLNVSRSYLQSDAKVRKISEYITKKVADKLSSLYKTDRENYEKYWSDIHPFIKYGCLRNEKFYERVKDCVIFRSLISDTFETLPEYLEKAKETHENKVFYADDPRQQAPYIDILKAENIDVLELSTTIDVPFISMLEAKHASVSSGETTEKAPEALQFLRVDADLSKYLKNESETVSDQDTENAEKVFRKLLEKNDLSVRLESMKDENISAMIELSEQSRRMQQMMRMYSQDPTLLPEDSGVLVLNQKNSLVNYVLTHSEQERSKQLANQLYDLARLSHETLSAQELTAFLSRSQQLLKELYQ